MFSDIATNSLAILSTVIAVLLVWAIRALTGSDDPWAIALEMIVLGTLCAILLFRLHLIAMMRQPGSWRVGARMESTWSYQDPETSETVEISDEIKIRQIGCLLLGSAVTSRVKGAPHKEYTYKITATINHEGIIQGEWKNTNRGRNYYGLYLAKLSRDGKAVEGKWIGVGTNRMHIGDWSWKASVT